MLHEHDNVEMDTTRGHVHVSDTKWLHDRSVRAT